MKGKIPIALGFSRVYNKFEAKTYEFIGYYPSLFISVVFRCIMFLYEDFYKRQPFKREVWQYL